MNQKRTERTTIEALCRECKSHREDVARWLEAAGYDRLNLDPAHHAEYVRIIQAHQRLKPGLDKGDKHRDKDGLTWSEAKQREETRKLKRDNEIAEKVLLDQWMTTSAHHAILSAIFSAIEQVPGKYKAATGCSAAHCKKLETMLDESRIDAVAATEKALGEAKKRVQEESE